MAQIEIPFCREMRAAVLEGRKVCTSRAKLMGEVGDEFLVDGRLYRIVDIQLRPLKRIRDHLYRLEGCESPDAFEKLWLRLHRGHYSENDYFVHWFARAEVV